MGGTYVAWHTCSGQRTLAGVLFSSTYEVWEWNSGCWGWRQARYSVNDLASLGSLFLISLASGLAKTHFCFGCFSICFGFVGKVEWRVICAYTCRCTRPRVSFLRNHPSCLLRQGLIKLELTKEARLCGQQAPGIYQPLPSQLGDYERMIPHLDYLLKHGC